ncbi:MAG: acetyl-CoA C-acetyltransferase [Burkholderiaceae bacterium]
MDAYILDHVRSPRGKGRSTGALHATTPVELARQTLAALRERSIADAAAIGDVGLGVVMPVGEQGADIARSALLCAGYPESVCGFQLNRFCVSSLDVLNLLAAAVDAGQAQAVIAGGIESMSRVAIGSDGGACYTDPVVGQLYPYIPNGVGADLLATLAGISREDLDAYALLSQRRAAAAIEQGHFAGSVVPIRDSIGRIVLAQDETVRPGTKLDELAQLKPAFQGLGDAGFDALVQRRYPALAAIDHRHTSGNSSAIADGASAMLLGSAAFARSAGLRPRARVRAFSTVGCEPYLTFDGPIHATRKLLAATGLSIDDIDLFEVNEAFAVVAVHYLRELGVSEERVNVNGGAIALGHPLGATGAMLAGTLLDELERRQLRLGVVTLCAGSGQSTATLIESLL